MSPLQILQLVGYSMAAALALWMGTMLYKRRHALSKIERLLFALSLSMGVWHTGNLMVALHDLLGLSDNRWTMLLRVADTMAVVSITFTYSFLLHVHLHLWADARARPLTPLERVRVYLSYIPVLFLMVAVPRLWTGAYAPMFDQLAHLLVPFACWAGYVLCLVAITDYLISRHAQAPGDKRLMQTLAASFISIAVLILAVYALGLGAGTTFGLYLKTWANIGALLPMALLAYHIYRYRYLELIIKESLIVASFAAVVLVLYFYVIRAFGVWLTARYALREGAVESLLILALALMAAPFRRWLDKRFRQLFKREAALYRDVVTRISAHAGRYQQLPDLLRFLEERTTEGLKLRRVQMIERGRGRYASDNVSNGEVNFGGGWAVHEAGDQADTRSEHDDVGPASDRREVWLEEIMTQLRARGWEPLAGESILRAHGFEMAYALRREDREVGLMLVDAVADALTPDVQAVLEILAGQVAVAIEDCRLVEENVRLERRVAHGARLAALGQMAATVAHEVKNPLSAIKSIAQVMREDRSLSSEYARDLDLIVGETDRLNRSVSQMLNFARHAPAPEASQKAWAVVQGVIELFSVEALNHEVRVEWPAGREGVESAGDVDLDGLRATALRDALTNLLLNALQATPAGRPIAVAARVQANELLISVTDGGQGVAPEIRERIWEPFFTTRQRGTGLGLAIVRKRMEEIGGNVRLAPTIKDQGAQFELRLPLASPPQI